MASEREAVTGSHGFGNSAAMREALERQAHFLQRLHAQEGENGVVSKVRLEEEIKAVTAALAAPPRQCDVGTAAEQSRRFCAFCRPRTEPCDGCSCLEDAQHGRCEFIWAQMPYEEGGAE